MTNPTPNAYPTIPMAAPQLPQAPQAPQGAAPLAPARPRSGLRLGAVLVVTLALAIALAAAMPPTVATARTLAYPRPAVSVSVSANATIHVNDPIQFTAQVQSGRDLSFSWDFGDETSGQGAQATHAYTTYSNYTVTLSVRDPIGQSASAQATVNVLPLPPQACFNTSPDSYDPLTINFNATCSTGAQLQYSWDFGDGDTNNNNGYPTTSHTYGGLKTYSVTLTVVDVAGQTASVTQSVTVTVPPPHAAFKATQDPYSPDCFNFDASASTGYQLQYSWSFGDGNTASYEYPYDCYWPSGTYYVTLTVTDALGRQATTTQTIYAP
jgi:PKD repeat protein